MVKKRLVWVDIAKAIAIICMIIGHEVTNNTLRVFIFSFHMPLFFILSGYTSGCFDTWIKFGNKTKKQFVKVWLLAVLMVILLGLENLLVGAFSFPKMIEADVQGIFWGSNVPWMKVQTVAIMWFLFVFFWAKILFNGLQVIFPNKYNGAILGILAYFAFVISQKQWLPQAFDIVPIAALFMWVGSFIKNLEKSTISSVALSISFGIIFCYWIFCVQNGITIEMATRQYPLFIVSILEAIAGTIVICWISKGLALKNYLVKPFQLIGQHTLAIMGIHQLDFYWLNWGNYFSSWALAAIARLIVDLVLLSIWLRLYSYVKLMNNSKRNLKGENYGN
ncbi:acyltransferase family protein [Limosilactobacillus reuteri]|uniref:acyltransferase family protein n=1 Tax=Limosilactobacillus reuteri TaxID=1598 RepID=UPI00177C35CD|nr:acyltransferase family protein [Limosilactobacillus reuteri]